MSLRRPEDREFTGDSGPRARSSVRVESAVLLSGLALSVAAGFAAWKVVGPYGDGPFGANFRRIPAHPDGETTLVHDSVSGSSVVRAVIDEPTGRIGELQIAPSGDFAKAVRVLFDEDRGVRVPLDLDGDGVAERWEYYSDVGDIESGSIEKVGFSLAGDEIVDAWAFHDEQRRVSRVEVSTARDGVVDRWEHYRGGVLVRVEIDTDRDGRVDRWETYRDDGVLAATAADGDGDGLPDPPAAGSR